jgi:hypothetical protein
VLSVWEDLALLVGTPLLVLSGLGVIVALGTLVAYWIRPA